MLDALQRVLEHDPHIAYALVFGSVARDTSHALSDVDVAVGLRDHRTPEVLEIGELVSKLEAAAGRPVDLVLLDEAPPGLAYRVFRDGRVLVEHDRPALVARKARAILEYLDFQPVEDLLTRGALAAAAVVDKTVLSTKVAAVRDAVTRIREVLPADVSAFLADRTTREVVILNLFVALQDSLALATHWLADAGADVPPSYREVFETLGLRGAVPAQLAQRLASASGLRSLVAHQYAVLDWTRIHSIATQHLEDLLAFCEELARRAASGDSR